MHILNPHADFTQIRAVSFDMDGVLVTAGDTPIQHITTVFDEVDRQLIETFLPHLDPDSAQRAARAVFKDTGDTTNFYKQQAQEMGVDNPEGFVENMMKVRMLRLMEALAEGVPQMFTPCMRVRLELFKMQELDVKLGIVTNSHGRFWADPVLVMQDLRHVFESVIGIDQYRHHKSKSPAGYEMSSRYLGVPAGGAHAFCEDQWKNFIPIKEAYPAAPTFLISSKPPCDDARPYVDVWGPDLAEMLFHLNRALEVQQSTVLECTAP